MKSGNFIEAYEWFSQSERRMNILRNFDQPMTASQIAHRIGNSQAICTYLFWELSVYSILKCLNSNARRSRVYWLTQLGKYCQRRLRDVEKLPKLTHVVPAIDWELYGLMCYSHRGAVIRALTHALQPSEIRRRIKVQQPDVKISANNVRDVIYFLRQRGVVKPVVIHRKHHRQYELTSTGKQIQLLLQGAC